MRLFMQYRLIIMLAATIVGIVMFLWLTLDPGHTNKAIQGMAFVSAISLIPTPGATATVTVQASNGNGSVLDPVIIAAIVGALIAGAFGVFGILYGTRQQKKILRFQKELDVEYAAKRQEEERNAATLEMARHDMLLAQTNAERAKAYRRIHVSLACKSWT